jgi:hypothetical protein
MQAIIRRASALLLTLTLIAPLRAEEPVDAPPDTGITAEIAAVDAAILHLMDLNPAHRVVVDAEYRAAVVAALVGAGHAHDVPPLLLTTIAYRESTFDHAATGQRGELGITQIMPRWEHALGCDLSTIGGQVDCSARMLARFRATCGSWPGALTLYATGKGCATGPVTTRKIASRIAQWQALEALPWRLSPATKRPALPVNGKRNEG